MLEMLFSTSLVALILSPRRLQITNTKVSLITLSETLGLHRIDQSFSFQRQSTICELTFPTTVLAVRLNRKRLVVILEDEIYLYDISNMKLLYTIETSPNPHGKCSLELFAIRPTNNLLSSHLRSLILFRELLSRVPSSPKSSTQHLRASFTRSTLWHPYSPNQWRCPPL